MSIFYKIQHKTNLKKITKENCQIIKSSISKFLNMKITIKAPNDLLIKKKNSVEYCKKLALMIIISF